MSQLSPALGLGPKALVLRTLGGLSLENGGRPIRGAGRQPARLAVLSVVALSGPRGVSRDRLLALFWPDADDEHARSALNQALYALRRDVGERELTLGTTTLRLNPGVILSDVVEFERAVETGDLERAALLYAGPFLDGVHVAHAADFEHWAEIQRGRLAQRHASALEQLARAASTRGDHTAAVELWRRLAAADPVNSTFALGLMQALTAAGDRAGAVLHAARHEATLHSELDLPPDPALAAFLASLRESAPGKRAHPPVTSGTDGAASTAPAAPAPAVALAPAATIPLPGRQARRWRAAPIAVAGLVAIMGFSALVARSGSDRYVVGRATQLTFEPGLEIEPAPSADGGLVAYAGGPAMRLRIYVRPPGGRAVRVTPDSGRSQQRPLWSPDGTRLLFTWGPPDGALALVPALGGEPRILVRDSVYAAAWAPEGRRVAYVRGDSLYVRSLERGTARAIVGLPEMSGLAWSPDGQHIAFAAGNAAFVMHWELGNKGPSEIAVVSADGGPLVHVTDGATLNASPVWAPDSRRLLFISDRDGPRDVYVVRVDAAGRPTGNLVRLTVGLSPHSIALSADGRRLTYSVFVQRVNIWSLPIAPTTVSQSAAVPVTTGTQVIEGLSISHDGRRLYFDSNREGNANLYRLDLPGGEPVQLTTDPADEFAPSESPDGRWVAFHSLRYGTRDIMVMPAEGGEPQRVTADSTDEMLPSWSPDGRTLVYDVFGVNEHNVLYQTSRDPDGRWGRPRPFRPSGVWSPDGRTAALCAGSVQIAAVAGGAPRLLYAPRPGSNDPGADQCVWIPDGRSLVMMSHDPDDVTSYWMLPAEGGRPRLLARLDDPARPALRSPLATDGKRIYFTLYDRQSDIYVTEVSGLNRR